MRLEEAISQVRTIQTQLARTEEYCCYRWATTAGSSVFAVMAAITQSLQISDPVRNLREYLTLWIGVAILSTSVIGAEILLQWSRSPSHYARRQTLTALQQFLPCVLAGAILTWGIGTAGSEHAALLPGLWATCFSLGVFASARHLPPGGVAVAGYYLAAGLVCIIWGRGNQALQPWTMLITFAVGQSLAAIMLFRRQEREDAAHE